MQKITPFIWFEKNMKEITDFYISVFPGTRLRGGGELDNTPSGSVQMATLNIYGMDFSLMTAGPMYKFTPAISFIINCYESEEADILWEKLTEKGKTLMPMDSYPFAKKYGWVEDKYGISWQVMFMDGERAKEKIIPTLMFAGERCGRAEEALDFYISVFRNAKIDYVSKYDGDEPIETNGKIKHAGFFIEGERFALMDSGKKSELDFEQAISFVINCENQAEVDYYWENLTKDGGQEIQCGWLKDKFGMPWQVVPTAMNRIMASGNKEKIARVTEAFMKMKKFDIKTLEEAFDGK